MSKYKEVTLFWNPNEDCWEFDGFSKTAASEYIKEIDHYAPVEFIEKSAYNEPMSLNNDFLRQENAVLRKENLTLQKEIELMKFKFPLGD